MIDSGRTKSETRLLTLLDLANAGSLGANVGADLANRAPMPNVAADILQPTPNVAADIQQPAVSVAGDAPTIAADGPAIGADLPGIGADGVPTPASVAADLTGLPASVATDFA